MPTQKVQLKQTEEVMNDYTAIYQAIYPLLMGRSTVYAPEVGDVSFRRVTTIGDVRAKHLTPKDTEIKQLAVSEGKKAYKKYFLANQFIQSLLQGQAEMSDIQTQVLDEHQLQFDELALYGDSSDNGATVVNNGLYFSQDPNFLLESAATIPTGSDRNAALHAEIMSSVTKSNGVSGRKLLIAYGDKMGSQMNTLYPTQPVAFRSVLASVLGPNFAPIADLPAQVTRANENGILIVNLDQVKFHYTLLPELRNQGVNEEKEYAWFNFMMGSCMVEPVTKNAIIRKPITFAT